MQKFKLRIKKLRMEKGFSQAELGKIIGVSGQTILNWENGIFEPRIKDLVALGDVFEVTIDELVGRTPTISDKERAAAIVSRINGKDLVKWIKERVMEMGDDEKAND